MNLNCAKGVGSSGVKAHSVYEMDRTVLGSLVEVGCVSVLKVGWVDSDLKEVGDYSPGAQKRALLSKGNIRKR